MSWRPECWRDPEFIKFCPDPFPPAVKTCYFCGTETIVRWDDVPRPNICPACGGHFRLEEEFPEIIYGVSAGESPETDIVFPPPGSVYAKLESFQEAVDELKLAIFDIVFEPIIKLLKGASNELG